MTLYQFMRENEHHVTVMVNIGMVSPKYLTYRDMYEYFNAKTRMKKKFRPSNRAIVDETAAIFRTTRKTIYTAINTMTQPVNYETARKH